MLHRVQSKLEKNWSIMAGFPTLVTMYHLSPRQNLKPLCFLSSFYLHPPSHSSALLLCCDNIKDLSIEFVTCSKLNEQTIIFFYLEYCFSIFFQLVLQLFFMNWSKVNVVQFITVVRVTSIF